MRIVTYNLRCDVKSDGVNSFSSRKGLVLDKIDRELPDVIGFQEVTPPMNLFLHKVSSLSGFHTFYHIFIKFTIEKLTDH